MLQGGVPDVDILLVACGSVLGFPRIGANRELKRLVEKFWRRSGTRARYRFIRSNVLCRSGIDEAELLSGAAELRRASWTMQKDLGLDRVPCNDFSLYDQVPFTRLQTSTMSSLTMP